MVARSWSTATEDLDSGLPELAGYCLNAVTGLTRSRSRCQNARRQSRRSARCVASRRSALFILLGLAGILVPALGVQSHAQWPGLPRPTGRPTPRSSDVTVVSIGPLNPAEPPPEETSVSLTSRGARCSRSWKGVDTGPLEITTSGEGGGCGSPIQGRGTLPGFRIPRPSRRALACVHLQPHSRKFNGRGAAADFLASSSAPASGGRVSARSERPCEYPTTNGSRTESTTETRAARRWRAGTTHALVKRPRYETNSPGLRRGRYRVDVVVPEGYAHIYPRVATFRFPTRVAARRKTSRSHPHGRITGRLVGPDGRGLPRLRVEVTPPEARPHRTYGLPDRGINDR